MASRDARVDAYIEKSAEFARPILAHLRETVHTAVPGAEETIKWGMPFFIYNGRILCSMAAFKAHAAFLFWRGRQVIEPSANRNDEAMGQFGKLTKVSDLPNKRILTGYLKKAVTMHEEIAKSPPKPKARAKKAPIAMPASFKSALGKSKKAKAAFDKLSPSHRREYLEWITEAKNRRYSRQANCDFDRMDLFRQVTKLEVPVSPPNQPMTKILNLSVATAFVVSAASSFAQAPTPVNLYVADVKYENGTVKISNPRKLTGDRGVNSQPSFTPDGKAILFVSRRDTTGQSDVYRIDLASRAETQVTKTAENENTPTVTPDGNLMVIRWLPATLFKEWGPWVYKNGVPSYGVLPSADTVGYYVRIDSVTFAMMRPKSRPAVALFDTRTKTMTDYAWPVANLPPQLVPHQKAISFTQTDSLGHNEIRMLDLRSMQSSAVAPALLGRTVHTWTPRGFILMGKGNTIYATKPGPNATWKKVVSMTQPDLQSINTYVVSPAGDKVILISPLKPTLQQALRDSIQSGKSIGDVIVAYRKAGVATTSYYDTSEGGILAVADERLTHDKIQDGLAIIRYDIELHPKSYDAQMALGAALKKTGDPAGAVAAYKKSLELNPRSSAGEKADAEAAEKAIAESAGH